MKPWTDDESAELDRANRRLRAQRERSIRLGMPESQMGQPAAKRKRQENSNG